MNHNSRTSIFDQIKCQPGVIIDKIYSGSSLPHDQKTTKLQSPWACKAVFQSLSVLAKCYVMKLLFVSSEFKAADFLHWSSSVPKAKEKNQEAFDELRNLRILIPFQEVSEVKAHGDLAIFKMNPHFQKSLHLALTSPIQPWSDGLSGVTNQQDSFAPTQVEIDTFSTEKWNDVLAFLVNLLPSNALPSNVLVMFVQREGLMVRTGAAGAGSKLSYTGGGSKAKLVITAKGYEYMLKDYLSQVWEFVTEAVKHSPSQEDALSLLFMLSYCSFGQGYPLNALTKPQQQLVFEFSQVGIIYMRSLTSMYFYPSRIAINMVFGAAAAAEVLQQNAIPSSSRLFNGAGIGAAASNGIGESSTDLESSISTTVAGGRGGGGGDMQQLKIIVETNSQVSAYLTNDIHLAMLQLFVDVTVRMPNLVLGRITRDKARQAFAMGIRASQIIDFMVLHAHPVVAVRRPIIPENVTDQLALWEGELKRLGSQEAAVVDFRSLGGYFSKDVFAELVTNLKHANVLLWEDVKLMTVAVSPTGGGVELVQSFVESVKQSHLARSGR